jgi:serpin B
MVIVLPDAGRFEEIVGSLDAAFLDEATAAATVRDVSLVMPKFEFTSEFSLKETLAELGIADAFDPGLADFTGITERRELFVQEVVHQAFISVDETGTEAAAATAVIAGLTAVADPPVPVRIDRPFVFMIEHGSTGEILFLGQVTNPAG